MSCQDLNFNLSGAEIDKSKGGIAVCDGMYQYIENCVIVLHDDHLRFFSENPVLSKINKTEFNGAITSLQIFKNK